MSLYARPWFRVYGSGRAKKIRAMYRDGFNVREIAYTFDIARLWIVRKELMGGKGIAL